MQPEVEFGRRLKLARSEAGGISQEALAGRLGVSPQTVVAWELGRKSPQFSRLPAIAEAVGKTVAWFFEEGEPASQASSAAPEPQAPAAETVPKPERRPRARGKAPEAVEALTSELLELRERLGQVEARVGGHDRRLDLHEENLQAGTRALLAVAHRLERLEDLEPEPGGERSPARGEDVAGRTRGERGRKAG